MSAVTTSVGLVNLALTRIGHNTITSIGESTKAGQLADVHYEAMRDAALRSHPWNFAIKHATLAQDDADAADDFTYQYALPSSPYCLKVIRTGQERDGLTHDYRIEGRYLKSDETDVDIEYIGRVTAVGEYDALFVQILALQLAIRFCMPLADNATLLGELKEELKDILPVGRVIDAQEGAARDFVDGSGWANSRL